jgi:hypothetical protein
MARYRYIGGFGRFRHWNCPGGSVCAQDNQASALDLDMVSVSPSRGSIDAAAATLSTCALYRRCGFLDRRMQRVVRINVIDFGA